MSNIDPVSMIMDENEMKLSKHVNINCVELLLSDKLRDTYLKIGTFHKN